MSKDFIVSITPGKCPKCYSSKTTTQGDGFVCLKCGETWSQIDENFAKGMMPDYEEGRAVTFRKTEGSKDLNE